jgi:hypothetical protein
LAEIASYTLAATETRRNLMFWPAPARSVLRQNSLLETFPFAAGFNAWTRQGSGRILLPFQKMMFIFRKNYRAKFPTKVDPRTRFQLLKRLFCSPFPNQWFNINHGCFADGASS